MALNNDEHFSQIETRIGKHEDRLLSIERSVYLYIGGIMFCAGAIAAFGAIVYAWGNSHIREQARAVMKDHPSQSTVTQTGKWTSINRLPFNEWPTFQWDLQEHVDPSKVVRIQTFPLDPLPGVLSSAELNDDGTKCIMRLRGSQEALSKLELPVDAAVSITLQD